MRIFRLALFALTLATPALAQNPNDCDRLAGYPMDPRLPGFPARAVITDPEAAVTACEAARATDADPFLAFLLARALEARDADDSRLPGLIAEGGTAAPAFAASRLGLLYANGHGGLPVDSERARALATESCDAAPEPHALAGCNNVAALMQAPEELAEAAALFQRTCEAGFGLSCSNLADRIEGATAPGIVADPAALRERACLLNDPYACVLVGYAHASAEPPDNAAAVRAYAHACELGEPQGCYALGLVLRDRTDVDTDWGWAQEALRQGCDGAIDAACYEYAVGLAYGPEGAGTDVPQADLDAARALFERLCEARMADACMDLGYLYAEAHGVAEDQPRALGLSARACAMGSAMGCNNLGVHLAEGQGVAQNLAQAARYYEQACAGGAGLGCANLADMVAAGQVGLADRERAADLYRKACERGDVDSCDREP